MGKHRFDRKKSVRFTLVPGPEKDGKPTVLFRPMDTKRSKVNKKDKKKMVSQISDYDQITINGKVVDDDQIPAYVLDQIRGRKDLLFNQMKGEEQEEGQGDLYQIQDGFEDGEFEEYQDDIEDENPIKQEEERDEDDEDWEDDDGEESEEIQERDGEQEKFETKMEQFPTLGQIETVNIEGKEYSLTKQQIDMLDSVIPQNYENINFGGVQFKKFNEDGLLLSEKQQYEKYLYKEDENVGIIDTYEYIPSKPIDVIDTDLNPSQIKEDQNLVELEDALNYDGQQEVYAELQDDFFISMIQGEIKSTKPIKKKQNKSSMKKQQSKKVVKEVETKVEIKPELTEKEMEQELQKAMFNFQNNIEEKKDGKAIESSDESEEDEDIKKPAVLNYAELEKLSDFFGRDGELDWRCLTKKQKKQFMKTKVIREGYDELRERQLQQKMKGKSNIKPEELHLKQIVRHIPFSEDHVMQKALEENLIEKEVSEEEYSSFSDEDDIVSFHQKTSILATNLSVIEQPPKEKKKKVKKDGDDESEHNISKVKVIPERRNRQQTSEQRKERKLKLKGLKKQKKQQKKEFAERFSKIKHNIMKQQNHTNPLAGVSYVKIH